jgi:hypothetical protein
MTTMAAMTTAKTSEAHAKVIGVAIGQERFKVDITLFQPTTATSTEGHVCAVRLELVSLGLSDQTLLDRLGQPGLVCLLVRGG